MLRTRRPPPGATVLTAQRRASTRPQSTIELGNRSRCTCSGSAANLSRKLHSPARPAPDPHAHVYPPRCQRKVAILASSETLPPCPGRASPASPEGGGLSQEPSCLALPRWSRTPSPNCNRESAAPRVILLPLAIRQMKSTLSIVSDAKRNRCASAR
jgi:hypothetical protein